MTEATTEMTETERLADLAQALTEEANREFATNCLDWLNSKDEEEREEKLSNLEDEMGLL